MTKKCPYCQNQLSELNESTPRTQHSHRSKARTGLQCDSCGYKQYSETTVMDRGNKVKQIDTTEIFERIPCNGVAVVRGDDKFIQNSTTVEDSEELEDEIKRANEYRKREGYDAFYFIVAGHSGREIEIDDEENQYEDERDLEDVAKYKVSDDGFEKLD